MHLEVLVLLLYALKTELMWLAIGATTILGSIATVLLIQSHRTGSDS